VREGVVTIFIENRTAKVAIISLLVLFADTAPRDAGHDGFRDRNNGSDGGHDGQRGNGAFHSLECSSSRSLGFPDLLAREGPGHRVAS
jgi:hypothetical protein